MRQADKKRPLFHRISTITPARPSIFQIKDVIKSIKKKKLGQFRGQVAILAITVGDDHGLRIRGGKKIRKPGFRLIGSQMNRPFDVAGIIINRMARIDKNRFAGLIKVKGLADGDIGNLLRFGGDWRRRVWRLNLIGPGPIHDEAKDTGDHKDNDGLSYRLFKHFRRL